MRAVFFALCLSCVAVGGVALSDPNLAWLAYGDIRGKIEPCGCDPRTDLGGIRRVSTLLARERAAHPNLIVFDLGNNWGAHRKSKTRETFLKSGLVFLNADAVLLNKREFERGEYSSDRRYILSNLSKSSPLRKRALPFLKIGEHVVFGFADLGSKASLAMDEALLEVWRSQLTGAKGTKFLLFSGADKQLAFVEKAGLFDEIISSNPREDDEGPTALEKEKPETLYRSSSVRVVPLYGLGVLRGGILRKQKTKSLAELVATPKESPLGGLLGGSGNVSVGADSLFGESFDVSWLESRYEEASPLGKMFEEYNLKIAKNFEERARKRAVDLADSPFIGAEACKTCHAKAYQAWKGSAHARAHETLEEGGKHKDAECVSCHVVGFDQKGGFASLETSPHLAGVQCENCHGPRREHAANPAQNQTPNKSTSSIEACLSCHVDAHSPSFEPKSYWEQIKHGF